MTICYPTFPVIGTLALNVYFIASKKYLLLIPGVLILLVAMFFDFVLSVVGGCNSVTALILSPLQILFRTNDTANKQTKDGWRPDWRQQYQ